MINIDLASMIENLENIPEGVIDDKNTDTLINRSIERCIADVYGSLHQKSPNITYEEVAQIVRVKLLIQLTRPMVIASNNVDEIYNYAKYMTINEQQLNDLADAIINSNRAVEIYCFARDIKGAPIDKLTEAIIRIGNVEYIKLFRDNIPGANKLLLNEALEKLKASEQKTDYSFKREPAGPRETADKGVSRSLVKTDNQE